MIRPTAWAAAHVLLISVQSFVDAGCHDRIPRPTPENQRYFAQMRVARPEITPAPEPQHVKRQAPGAGFIGWETLPDEPNSYTSISCIEGDVWTVSNGYGNCCPPGECTWYTMCDATVAYAPEGAVACPTNEVCNTWPIYPSYGASESVAWVGCATDLETFYVESPTAVPTTIAPLTSASSATSSSSASASSSSGAGGGSKSDIGAIVGGVVGGVAFLGLLALIGFLVWMHHRKSQQQSFQDPSSTTVLIGPGGFSKDGMVQYSVQQAGNAYTPPTEYSPFPQHQMPMNASPPDAGRYYQQTTIPSELPPIGTHSPLGFYPSQSPVAVPGSGAPSVGYQQPASFPPPEVGAPAFMQVPHHPSPGL